MSTQEILDRLNTYAGENIWEDVINGLGVDKAATDEIDPSYGSDRFVLTDGTRIAFDPQRKEWYEQTS